MKAISSKILTSYLLILCFSTLIYIEPVLENDKDFNNSLNDVVDDVNTNIETDDEEIYTPIRKTSTPGDYQTQAFFSYNTFTSSLDGDGPGYQWEAYEDIPGQDGTNLVESRFGAGNNLGSVPNFPGDDVYILGGGYLSPYYNGIMFSPVLTHNTTVDGKIHYLTNIHRHFEGINDNIDINLRITLWHFQSSTGTSNVIRTAEYLLPTAGGGNYWQQQEFDVTLSSPYIVPAGDRFKVSYHMKISNSSVTGHLSVNILKGTATYIPGDSLSWNIVDGIYSNSYSFTNLDGILGVQLLMREDVYPDIQVFNAVNETVYDTDRNIGISVTPGSNNFYRWNGGTFVAFGDSINIPLLRNHGWSNLEISSSDPVYNNTVVETYQFGYDGTVDNIVLINAVNETLIPINYNLLFDVSNITSATYEWDTEGSNPWVTLYDITTPIYSGLHNLTIVTTEFYQTKTYFYQFLFDSTPPEILLTSPNNDTLQAPGKSINVEVTDPSGLSVVSYRWDSDLFSTWTPLSGNLYRTNLPDIGGWHLLYVKANDTIGNSDIKKYRFFTDPTILNVELRDMINNSYFIGGNAVELTITSSNDTIKFQWDGGTIFDKSDAYWDGTYLMLNESYVLPSTQGVHTLTIITGDLSHDENVFVFTFTIDHASPVFASSLYDYNNVRFTGSETLNFYISDNYTLDKDIILEISVDGGLNLSLVYFFHLTLLTFFDGNHSITFFARDIAGNYNVTTIYVIVDNTAPEIDITIPEIVNYLYVDGNYYVPANALVDVILTDADPTVTNYYSINGSMYSEFTDNFLLGTSEGYLEINILANDTLGNYDILQFYVILDNTAPSLSLDFPFNITSEINHYTELKYYVDDISALTIDSVEYEWDAVPGFFADAFPDINGYFMITLTTGLETIYNSLSYDSAVLTFVLVDIVGNTRSINCVFDLDYTEPIDAFYLTDEETGDDLLHISNYMTLFINGSNQIHYNESYDDDIILLEYFWDGNDEDTVSLEVGVDLYPWFIEVPDVDGTHNLTVRLYDNTGEELYPNIREEIYFLTIDDLNLEIVTPGFVDNHFYGDLIYKDNFTFTFNVTDTFTHQALDFVNISWLNPIFNITIFAPVQLDNVTYQITITANDVTNGQETVIEFHVGQFEGSYEAIYLHLTLLKREGTLLLISSNSISIEYGDMIQLEIMLNDNLNISALDILNVEVNSTSFSFDFNDTTKIARFNYSSSQFVSRYGNYTLEIFVESDYHYDILLDSNFLNIEINQIPVILTLTVSNYTIIEDTQLGIEGTLTYLNGTPVAGEQISIYIYIYFKDDDGDVNAALPEGYDNYTLKTSVTNSQGEISVAFDMGENIDYIIIQGIYEGGDIHSVSQFIFEDIIITIPPPGIPSWILYLIIGGSLVILGIISLIIYKVTRPKPFVQLMSKISNEEIALNYSIVSPGVVLSIFDQRKGPIPLISDHSLEIGRYIGRMQVGIENFMLKISDQAYSSLGFEDHDAGRRVGSIILPSEKMVGFLHGIQLGSKSARGGFENLSLIVLADSEYGKLLLNYQEHLFDDVDELITKLKSKNPLKEVEEIIKNIRKTSVVIILAAQKIDHSESNGE